jgi:PHD/YefM family antitoxin component YafN of YafNO toxin-antitoxin module
MVLHPNILEKDGQKAFAILPYEEFIKVQEALEDYDDLKALRHAKQRESSAATISLEEARHVLGI